MPWDALVEYKLEEVQRAVARARVRALRTDEILDELRRSWSEACYGELLAALRHREVSVAHAAKLADLCEFLGERAGQLPRAQRDRAWRVLNRLSPYLSERPAVELASKFVSHRHQLARRIGVRIFRRIPVPVGVASVLLARFEETGEQEFLELIARSTDGTMSVDLAELLENLSEEYWKGRVLAIYLERDRERALARASSYPRAFAHAVARSRDPEACECLVQRVYPIHRSDLDFLDLYAYALGCLGRRDEIESLKLTLDNWDDTQT